MKYLHGTRRALASSGHLKTVMNFIDGSNFAISTRVRSIRVQKQDSELKCVRCVIGPRCCRKARMYIERDTHTVSAAKAFIPMLATQGDSNSPCLGV